MRIETERLILREIDPDRDFEPWAESMADERVVRYLGTPPMNRAQAWRNMAMVLGHWSMRGYGFFSVELKSTGAWIGRVGPWHPDGWPGREIGWTIAPAYQRQGYALEAARASLDLVRHQLGWDEVVHVIMEGNEPSMALARALGSRPLRRQDGLPGVTEDAVWIYGQALD